MCASTSSRSQTQLAWRQHCRAALCNHGMHPPPSSRPSHASSLTPTSTWIIPCWYPEHSRNDMSSPLSLEAIRRRAHALLFIFAHHESKQLCRLQSRMQPLAFSGHGTPRSDQRYLTPPPFPIPRDYHCICAPKPTTVGNRKVTGLVLHTKNPRSESRSSAGPAPSLLRRAANLIVLVLKTNGVCLAHAECP